MSLYALPPLLSSLLFGILAAFVWTRRNKTILNTTLGLASFVTCWWQASWVFLFSVADLSWANVLVKIGYSGIIFIPFTLYHFFVTFARSRRDFPCVILSYAAGAGFLILLWTTPLFIDGVYRYKWGFYPKAGFLHPLFLLILGVLALRALFLLRGELLGHRPSTRRRNQVKYVLAALAAYLPASSDFLVNYGVGFYPLGFIPILVTLSSLAYAIVRYRLLEIEIVIKKTLIFTGLFGMVMVVVGVVMAVSQSFVGRYLSRGPLASTTLSVFVAILLYDPTRSLLVRLTDRFLFQKREPIKEILRRLSERIITILDLGQVAKTILDTFEESLRAESGAILLKNETDYRILNSFGLVGPAGKGNYSLDHPLLQYLRSHPEVVDLESEETCGRPPLPVSGALEKLAAVVAIPLVLHGELLGLLTLGKKKSDLEYSSEEIEYFPTVAGQVAIALSNARLYGEAVEAKKKIEAMQLELIHREKMAFVADLVKGIAHEVFNPLLPVYHAIGELETDVLVGLFDLFKRLETQLDPETHQEYLKLLKALRSATRTVKVNSEHIHLVIDTLDKLRKEDKETIGPMDFKIFLKDSRALIGMELHSEEREIPVIEDIHGQLPPVKGNPTLLAQVFVNLFKNAIHAMEGSLEKKITIKAEADPEKTGFLKIDFSDTGLGIPADILRRIFDFGFTTKGKQGQGIGLAQCKLIIEKFGGTIECRSKAGEGATFTLHLPLYEKERYD